MVRFIKICLLQASVLLLVQVAFGQILGSSSNIFTTKTKTVNSTPKKKVTVAKTKPTTSSKQFASKPKTTPAKSVAVKTTTKKSPLPKTSKSFSNNSSRLNSNRQPQNNISIVVGQPTTGDFDEMFEQAIDEGNIARDERNYQAAEKAYLKSQTLKPKDERWIYGLGNIFSDQQRWEEAEKAYRTAINLEPKSPEAHIALSFVLTQPISGANLSERFDEAEVMARKAISLDARNPVAYDQLGVSLEMRGGISDETKEAYLKAIELDSTNALAFAHLGRLYRRNDKQNESSAAYRKAIQLATDVPTMILVAEVFQTQQKFTESEQLLRKALAYDKKNPTALYLLGRALKIRASFEEAENVLKKSLEISPKSFITYSELSSVYSRRGRFDDSEKTLNQALKVSSISEKKQLAQEFAKLGDDFMKNRRATDAVRVFKQALGIDNGNTELLNKLSNAQKTKN